MSLSALSHLVSIEEIAAAFVSSSKGHVLAREVPERYTDQGLSQIASQMSQILNTIPEANECRLAYDNFGIWLRRFGDLGNYSLVIFFERETDPTLLRQPINLAILNLQGAIRQIEENSQRQAAQSDLFRTAQKAEHALAQAENLDTNQFLVKLILIAAYFIGPIGPELVQHACRELNLALPLTQPEHMRALARHCANQLPNPNQKNAFLSQAEDLIQRTALSS